MENVKYGCRERQGILNYLYLKMFDKLSYTVVYNSGHMIPYN